MIPPSWSFAMWGLDILGPFSSVLWLRTPPPCWEGLRRRRVSYDFEPCFPAGKGSGAATRIAIPYVPWSSSIKKGLADLPMQIGSYVFKARVHVPKAPDARGIMGLQNVRAGSVINACKMCG
jgi:hypothetical protein